MTDHSTWLWLADAGWFAWTAWSMNRRAAPWLFMGAMLCSLVAYHAAMLSHRWIAGRVFAVAYILIYFLSLWWGDPMSKRLWGQIKSVALTALNAASFQRQSREAFQ